MVERSKGWAWFDRDGPGPNAPAEDVDLPDAGRELRRAYAKCFAGAEGAKVLAHLRALTLDRALGPDATAAQLRHLEGQRQLVRYIAQQGERGRGGA